MGPSSGTTTQQQAKLSTRKPRRAWPRFMVDLSLPAQRRMAVMYALGLFIFAIGVPVVAVQGYEYTESSEFCGTLCHSMTPQHEQHSTSLHSNVTCANCHIGSGVDHFVRSKIAGVNQLFHTLSDSYNRPIKGPVKDLRPARETCETCHNPISFKDNIIKTLTHYDSDKDNTKLQTTLVLKMGGKLQETGFSQGIHWHISSKVYYIPVDAQRQIIAWTGVEHPDGSMTEYFSRDILNMDRKGFVADARANNQIRTMDCIDCHNRTAHYIESPQAAVDRALSLNLLSTGIPYIRSKAVEVLSRKYNSRAEADAAIDALGAFYQQNYPSAVAGKLISTVAEIKRLNADTSFPEMKLFWDTNPDFERHGGSSGCFRCHDDKHVNVDSSGKIIGTIDAKCNTCHSVPITTRGSELNVNTPIIGSSPPATHNDFRWTIEHRTTTEVQKQQCYQCHGQASCSNSICHGVSHPPDMLFSHPVEYQKSGAQTCQMCHQDVLCNRCHVTVSQNGRIDIITGTLPFTNTNSRVNGPLGVTTNTVTNTNPEPRKLP